MMSKLGMIFAIQLIGLQGLVYACHDIGGQSVMDDPSCANGGIGCNAGGQGQNCRFCGFSNFPPCSGGGGPPSPSGGAGNGHAFLVNNKCSYPVYMFHGTQKQRMEPGGHVTLPLSDGWNGRIWGRLSDGAQAYKDTLVEFTFDGYGNQDYYDVSLVDGYNLAMAVYPKAGTFKPEGGQYNCKQARCSINLDSQCPEALRYRENGRVVACKSACETFNQDRYCCRGAHSTPQTCKPDTWPVNYAAQIKSICPDAYSYAYDDHASTFTCRSNGNSKTQYHVEFCP